jgi:hypothetical protein
MLPTCKSWDLKLIGGLEQTSFAKVILLCIAEAKACWRAILTCYLKNWMQKDKDKWPFNRLSWKKQAHPLMKWSISRPSVPWTSMAIEIKWCLSWSLLYLRIFAIALSSTTTPINQLMTFIATISHVES